MNISLSPRAHVTYTQTFPFPKKASVSSENAFRNGYFQVHAAISKHHAMPSHTDEKSDLFSGARNF
jgi:hypothetical protein